MWKGWHIRSHHFATSDETNDSGRDYQWMKPFDDVQLGADCHLPGPQFLHSIQRTARHGGPAGARHTAPLSIFAKQQPKKG